MHPHWTKFRLQSICIKRLNISRIRSRERGSRSLRRLSIGEVASVPAAYFLGTWRVIPSVLINAYLARLLT